MFNNSTIGGGFMENGGTSSPGVSPSVQGKRERKSQNIVNVTCRMILESEDVFKLHDNQINMVVVVGLLRSVEVTSTKTTYTIDDGTGVIEAVHWDNNSEFKGTDPNNLMEMTYCRVVGSVRTQQEKKNLIVFDVSPVTDLNQITNHLLEVIHDDLKLRQMNRLTGTNGSNFRGSISNANPNEKSLPSNEGTFDNYVSSGLTGAQKIVYQMIHQSTDEAGIGRQDIYRTLQGKVSSGDIDNVLDFLSSEGHIYTTIDEDTFRPTDG